MFADADVFWKWPSVYDAFSVVGLIASFVSIWLALRLAKQQLRADFKKAADEAVGRVAQMVLGNELSDAIRYLREVDKAISETDWARAMIRLEDAAAAIARTLHNPRLTPIEQLRLRAGISEIQTILSRVRRHSRTKLKHQPLPATIHTTLGTFGNDLESLRSRLIHQ